MEYPQPSPRDPLPWRKDLVEQDTTPRGRQLKRFAIVDAMGLVVMEQYMILERGEETIDFALTGEGAPAPENPLPWSKRLMQLARTSTGQKLERYAVVDAYGGIVLFQQRATFGAEQSVDYLLHRVNARVVREVERAAG